MTVMEAVLTGIIAVIGTLLGAVVSFYFQERSTERNEVFQRTERVRQERLNASKALAAALHEYREGQYVRWKRADEEWDGASAVAARTESYKRGAVVRQAISHVRLLFEDGMVIQRAQHAFDEASKMHHARDHDDLEMREASVRSAIDSFLEAVGSYVR